MRKSVFGFLLEYLHLEKMHTLLLEFTNCNGYKRDEGRGGEGLSPPKFDMYWWGSETLLNIPHRNWGEGGGLNTHHVILNVFVTEIQKTNPRRHY